MWRPDDWQGVKWDIMRMGKDNPTYKGGMLAPDSAFEAGADAILEALKNNGVFTYGYHTPDIDLDDAPEVSGYWVFIPEEDKG